ncbi:hypothetical protein Tco_0162942 [Tanacetum coccineum]
MSPASNNAFRAQRIANTHDLLALMANTQTPFHLDHSSLITYIQHPQPNNNFVSQPLFNTNHLQHPMQNPGDISNPTTAFNMALALMAKAITLNEGTQHSECNAECQESGYPGYGSKSGGEDHKASNFTVNPMKWMLLNFEKMQIAQKEKQDINSQSEKFDFMAAADGTAERHLEMEIERLYDSCPVKTLWSIVQNPSVIDSSNLQTELDSYKERLENRSKKNLASPKPSKLRSCLRWSPTGRFFDLKGKIITSSESESQSDCSKVDMIDMTSMVDVGKSIWSFCSTNISNEENQVVTKSSAVTTADASDKCQQQQDSTSSTSTLATTIFADGNFDL